MKDHRPEPHCDEVDATRRIRAEHPGHRGGRLTTYDDVLIVAALEA